MYLFGTTVMRMKGVIKARIAGLRQGIEGAVAALLEQHPLTNEELIPKLIERLRLEPVEVPPVDWKDRDFHIAQPGSYGIETFYAFNRDIPYTGTTELWRYRPPDMFDVMLKAKIATATGEVTINGLCTDAERSPSSAAAGLRPRRLRINEPNSGLVQQSCRAEGQRVRPSLVQDDRSDQGGA